MIALMQQCKCLFSVYNKDLESEVKSETSGNYQNFLTQILDGKKEKETKTDQSEAEKHSKALHEVLEILIIICVCV